MPLVVWDKLVVDDASSYLVHSCVEQHVNQRAQRVHGSGPGGTGRKGLYTDMKEQALVHGTWRTACTVAFLPPDFEGWWGKWESDPGSQVR